MEVDGQAMENEARHCNMFWYSGNSILNSI